MGPIGVKKHLAPFLPSHPVVGSFNSLSCRLSICKNSYSDLRHIFRFEEYMFDFQEQFPKIFRLKIKIDYPYVSLCYDQSYS
jgi:hypothetical protein